MATVTVGPEARERILSTAETVFREQGFKRGTVRRISEACGLSVGAVASVGTKEQLLVCVVERKIAALPPASPSRGSRVPSPADAICQRLEEFFDFFEGEWALAREYASVLATGRYESDVFPALADELVEELSDQLQNGAGDPHSTRVVAQSIYLSYLGSLYLWTVQGVDARPSCERRLHEAVRLLACSSGTPTS